jgi:3-hydroxybutyryl-CoA dehydrogenase
MKIVVVADNDLQEELLAQGLQDNATIEWTTTIPDTTTADYIIDLLFENNTQRIESLQKLQTKLFIVNAVSTTLERLPENFIRINGWPGFLQRSIIEAAAVNEPLTAEVEKIFSCFNKSTEWVPDKAGFVTATIISMIINEAYFTAGEQVSSKEEIDTAMKLGTNYPFGPFEWSKKIGLHNIYELLTTLSQNNVRYQPAELLTREAISL